MGNNWKEMLAKCFEDNQILISSIGETRDKFDNFCEFIAEPSFAQLKEELNIHKVGAKIQIVRGDSISFQANFVRSSICQFQYTVYLPKNSIHLVLKSRVGGRKDKKGIVELTESLFMEGDAPSAVMEVSQEDFIHDVIRHYRNFLFNSTVHTE